MTNKLSGQMPHSSTGQLSVLYACTHGQLVFLDEEPFQIVETGVQTNDRVLAAHAAGDNIAKWFGGHLVVQKRECEEEGSR